MVAADHRTLDHGSEDPLLAAMIKRPVVCGGHGWSLSVQRLAQLTQPPTRCRWHGCAGGSGMMLELLTLASVTTRAGSMVSTPTGDLLVCRQPCTRAFTRKPA